MPPNAPEHTAAAPTPRNAFLVMPMASPFERNAEGPLPCMRDTAVSQGSTSLRYRVSLFLRAAFSAACSLRCLGEGFLQLFQRLHFVGDDVRFHMNEPAGDFGHAAIESRLCHVDNRVAKRIHPVQLMVSME